jgi:ribose/xylose/arabinose/galactoside ABC-type transport system permease subunit
VGGATTNEKPQPISPTMVVVWLVVVVLVVIVAARRSRMGRHRRPPGIGP